MRSIDFSCSCQDAVAFLWPGAWIGRNGLRFPPNLKLGRGVSVALTIVNAILFRDETHLFRCVGGGRCAVEAVNMELEVRSMEMQESDDEVDEVGERVMAVAQATPAVDAGKLEIELPRNWPARSLQCHSRIE